MNARVLELLKSPDLICNTDLRILESEIKKTPYVQSLRSIYLLGIHQFAPKSYATELTKTAAYTTDKKILYQFINGRFISETTPVSEPEIASKNASENGIESKIETTAPVSFPTTLNPISETEPKTEEELKPISEKVQETEISNEEANENTQNSLEINKKIEEKPSIEANSLIAEIPTNENEVKSIEELVSVDNKEEILLSEENQLNHTAEISVVEEKPMVTDISSEEIIEKPKEDVVSEENAIISKEEVVIIDDESSKTESDSVNFHGSDHFLPDVKINITATSYEAIQPVVASNNKHDEEMKKLIAEVEAKLKLAKNQIVAPQEISENETKKSENSIEKAPETTTDSPVLTSTQKTEKIVPENTTTSISQETTWKPMNFLGTTPISVTSTPEKPSQEPVKSSVQSVESVENSTNQKNQEEERPVFNVSFFSPEVSQISTDVVTKENLAKEEPKVGSNVTSFINTWQSWLKIDRDETKISNKKESKKVNDSKSKIIEKFIENEPKISKLKEDSDFVVKEKTNDISHLMTETLAKLYTEQKLYSKAINAYEILTQKHPEKTEIFQEKILEIKNLKLGKPS